MKKAQHPWTLAKAFKDSTPVGSWFEVQPGNKDLQNLTIHLEVNGKTRQHVSTADMLFSVSV